MKGLVDYIEKETRARMRFYDEDEAMARSSVIGDINRRVGLRMRKTARRDPDEWVMGSDAARAVGRFRPEGVLGYRAATAPNAPLRATRPEAVEDERAWRTSRRIAIPAPVPTPAGGEGDA